MTDTPRDHALKVRHQRTAIESLPEDQLRKEILVPLLEAMGFQGVTVTHGSTELGKDLVMWEQTVLGRVNVAVIAKAGPITGQAQARSGSASTTYAQILQAFGAEYLDPVTNERQTIHRCLVVASGSIKQPSLTSLAAMLKNSRVPDGSVTYWNGDTLGRFVKEHLQSMTIAERAQELQDLIKKASDAVDVAVTVAPSMTTVVATAKPGKPPPAFRMLLAFPDTPEGRAAREALDLNERTGSPASISGAFVRSVDSPLLEHLGYDARLTEVYFGERVSLASPLPLVLVAEAEGERVESDPIAFAIRAGTEEVTLTSQASEALVIEMRVRPKARTFDMNVRIEPAGRNVREALRVLQIQSVLSRGARVSFLDARSRVVRLLGEGSWKGTAPAAESTVDLMKALVAIQERLNVALTLPPRPIPADEVKEVFLLGSDVDRGVRMINWETLDLPLSRGRAAAVISAFEQRGADPLPLRFTQPDKRTVLETEVDLGPCEVILSSVVLADLELAKKHLADRSREPVNLALRPGHSNEAILRWPRFTPQTWNDGEVE